MTPNKVLELIRHLAEIGHINMVTDDGQISVAIKDYADSTKSTKIVLAQTDTMEQSLELTKLLVKAMRYNDPGARIPDNLDKWYDHMDRLIRIDRRDPKEIFRVIRWCQTNDFWKGNILSTQKLRDKYPTLKLQMERESNGTANRKPSPTIDSTTAAYEQAKRHLESETY